MLGQPGIFGCAMTTPSLQEEIENLSGGDHILPDPIPLEVWTFDMRLHSFYVCVASRQCLEQNTTQAPTDLVCSSWS